MEKLLICIWFIRNCAVKLNGIIILTILIGCLQVTYLQWRAGVNADREAKLQLLASHLSHHILSDNLDNGGVSQVTGNDVIIDDNWLATKQQDNSNLQNNKYNNKDRENEATQNGNKSDAKFKAIITEEPPVMTPHRDTSRRSKDYCNPVFNITHGHEGKLNSSDYKLVNVHVIIRHGDRSPIYSLPNYPIPRLSCRMPGQLDNLTAAYLQFASAMQKSHMKMFPAENMCEGSQLTPRGLRQHLYNGRHLSDIYVEKRGLFRENGTDWDQVYMRSTHYSRTYQSAWAFLYGFMGDTRLPEKVALVTESFTTNFCSATLSRVPCYCPAVGTLDAALRKEHFTKTKNHTDYKEVKKKIGKVLGIPASNVPWVGAILDVIMSYTCHKMAIPCISKTKQCFTHDLIADMWSVSDEINSLELKSSTRTKYNDLMMYPLMREIAIRYQNITTGISNNKLTLYSGHDKTLTPLTVAFGINDAKWPPYASRLVMELYFHQLSSLYYLRVIYNGRDVTYKLRFCDKLKQTGDGIVLCPLSEYLKFVFHDQMLLYNSTSYIKACAV